MSRFKDIVLDLEQLLPKLKKFADADSVQESLRGRAAHYTFSKDGQQALLIVHKRNDAKVTLQTSSGQHPEISERAADAILEDTVQPLVDNATITVANWSKENFEALVDYLAESCSATKGEAQNNSAAHSIQIKMTGVQGDIVSITYFETTHTLLVQGRPVLLIREAISFIGSYSSVNNELYLDYLNKIFGTTTDISAVETIIKRECPNSFDFGGPQFRKILISSYQMLECNINFADANVFLFDAFRGVEFFIKELFFRNGRQISNIEGFSGIFTSNDTHSSFKLKEPFSCRNTNMAIEECYGYYKAHRHEGFHASAIPAMTQILNPSEAKGMARRALELIEKHCTALKSE